MQHGAKAVCFRPVWVELPSVRYLSFRPTRYCRGFHSNCRSCRPAIRIRCRSCRIHPSCHRCCRCRLSIRRYSQNRRLSCRRFLRSSRHWSHRSTIRSRHQFLLTRPSCPSCRCCCRRYPSWCQNRHRSSHPGSRRMRSFRCGSDPVRSGSGSDSGCCPAPRYTSVYMGIIVNAWRMPVTCGRAEGFLSTPTAAIAAASGAGSATTSAARPVAPIALSRFRCRARAAFFVLTQRTANIVGLVEFPLRISPYITLITFVGLDELSFSRHSSSLGMS